MCSSTVTPCHRSRLSLPSIDCCFSASNCRPRPLLPSGSAIRSLLRSLISTTGKSLRRPIRTRFSGCIFSALARTDTCINRFESRSLTQVQCPLWVKADICGAKGHVRFSPESGHVRCTRDVRFVPIADIQHLIRSLRRHAAIAPAAIQPRGLWQSSH